MTAIAPITGAPSGLGQQWKSIQWKPIHAHVHRLQVRIAQAVKQKPWNKVKALQRILVHSSSARLLAVKKVTSRKGSRTPGIDGQVWHTPAKKMRGAMSLKCQGYKAKPLRRKLIPKKNGKTRALGIPCIGDRAMQALWLLALEPVAETLADPNSYGFRPYRACRDAIGQCFCALAKKHSPTWVLDADIKKCRGHKTEIMIRKLNPIIRGWAQYHRFGESGQTFWRLHDIIHFSLFKWAKRRNGRKTPKWLRNHFWACSRDGKHFACSIKAPQHETLELINLPDVPLARYTKVKGLANPYDPGYKKLLRYAKVFEESDPLENHSS